MTLYSGQRPSAALLNSIIPQFDSGTYSPGISATSATPVLGASGFLTGRWYRLGRVVTAFIDLNIAGSGSSIVGTSWRLELPFLADASFHVNLSGTLDDTADDVSHYVSRSSTAAQSLVGTGVLGTYNSVAGTGIVIYKTASSTSVGSADFTTTARIHAQVTYVADASEF